MGEIFVEEEKMRYFICEKKTNKKRVNLPIVFVCAFVSKQFHCEIDNHV
jgi:hypothetical protein